MSSFSIATWNVNSIIARLPLALEWLAKRKPDVVCLQETKCVDERFPAEAFRELGYESASHGQPTYNGVAILARTEITEVVRGFPGEETLNEHKRLIEARVNGVRVISAYFPNGQSVGTEKYRYKLEWMSALRRYLDEQFETGEPLALCGDFNVAPEDRDVYDPNLWRGRILCSQPERDALTHIKDWGLHDSFRLHTREGGHYSWWDYRQGSFRRNNGLRIDHVWISDGLLERCTACTIETEPRTWERPSDHTPVVAEFE